MQIINPATGRVLKEIEPDAPHTIEKKYIKAKKAQREWSKTPIEKRTAPIIKYLELLEKQKTKLKML